jgi:hypothetical protein
MNKFKVGDNVRGSERHFDHRKGELGTVASLSGANGYLIRWGKGANPLFSYGYELEPAKKPSQKEAPKAPVSGGPSKYYDYPFKDWTTGNDMMEYFATEVWGAYSLHFKDIFKAGLRWGNKSGTTEEYDARKIVYSGLRLLGMVAGKQTVADYLKELSEDQQFKGEH